VMFFTVFSMAKAQIIIIPKIFEDVSIFHPFATFIGWLKDNGVTSGYPDGTFRPDNFISRAEMAKMLKNTASTVVAAGAHVEHNGTNFEITEWFNNVNGQEPTHSWFLAHFIDFGFDPMDKFVQCTVDMDDSVSSFCTAKTGTGNFLVVVYDVESTTPTLENHGFWILVYGNDIQP
jgi:hypothetical protein